MPDFYNLLYSFSVRPGRVAPTSVMRDRVASDCMQSIAHSLGYTYANSFFNFPAVAPGVPAEPIGRDADVSPNPGPDDLLVVATRPPLQDHYEQSRPIARSFTPIEVRLMATGGPLCRWFDRLARNEVVL